MKKILLILSVLFFGLLAFPVFAYNVGQEQKFFVESKYDKDGRSDLSAVLVKSANNIYFYIDKKWWDAQDQSKQAEVLANLDNLSNEFSSRIYPVLTSVFGPEWNPGIDKDSKITVLLQAMSGEDGGYFRTNDEYSKLQFTDSNEKEMLYLNVSYINSPWLKSFLAHEFMHLISFNQKENINGVSEDVWLDEARAEYAPTLLGYDDIYSGSYLEKRVQHFSEKPSGSLVDWQNTKYDYARADLFANYLVDQYGVKILSETMRSNLVGIDSINNYLQQKGYKEDLLQIFSNWTIAVLINNCTQSTQYCYTNKNLKNFSLVPQVNFLPVSGDSTLTFADKTRYWSGNWYKIIGGGGGALKFNFVGDPTTQFKVYYITKSSSGAYVVSSMELTSAQKGYINIKNFGSDVSALYVIPVLKDGLKIRDNFLHSFSWSASITRAVSDNTNTEALEIQRLQAAIAEIQQKIAAILAQRGQQNQGNTTTCQLNYDLSVGSVRNEDVKCLQNFLKSQGPEIYPEGFVTGFFGNITKAAVIKFQARYGVAQTGYVGPITRNKINQILTGS